mgnify:FL=1|tara:strand:+ start:1969 stop:2841 length:873 start_codon:yes stop_codon:yes gene_type:complete
MARQQKSYFSNDKLVKTIEQFRTALGAPSMSNFFRVQMDLANVGPEPVDAFPVSLDSASSSVYQKEKVANDLSRWLTSCGLLADGQKETYEILCNEAMLPGVSMSVVQEVGSRQGIRERFATQRQYTDISLTFFVSQDYKSLKLFQEWINFMNPLYVTQEGVRHNQGYPGGYPNNDERFAYHRFRYPHDYKRDLSITKFERNLGADGNNEEFRPDAISYNFINAFPISIQDIPLNYAGGNLLQVTVEFAYDRYYIVNNKGTAAPAVPQKGLSQVVNAENVSENTVDKASN